MLKERKIKRALRTIAGQRVTMILEGNVSVIENSPAHTEEFEIAVRTAHIRGWVEVLHNALPTGQIQFQGDKPIIPETLTPQDHYRLTEGGWAVIHGTHTWVIWAFIVGFLSLLASLVGIVLPLLK